MRKNEEKEKHGDFYVSTRVSPTLSRILRKKSTAGQRNYVTDSQEDLHTTSPTGCCEYRSKPTVQDLRIAPSITLKWKKLDDKMRRTLSFRAEKNAAAARCLSIESNCRDTGAEEEGEEDTFAEMEPESIGETVFLRERERGAQDENDDWEVII